MQERLYQKECKESMKNFKGRFAICELFCGTGKTFIFTDYIKETNLQLTIITVPRIILIKQYVDDYYNKDKDLSDNFELYSISSEDNDIKETNNFINKNKNKKNKIILITHDSFPKLCEILKKENIHVNTLIIDEVHHFGESKKRVDVDNMNVDKVFGFTATPSSSQLKNDTIIYRYGYASALRDGYCRNFEIDLYLTDKPKNKDNMYEALFFIAETLKLKNILCFHAYSEVEGKNGKSSVQDFQNSELAIVKEDTYFKKGVVTHTITGKLETNKRIELLKKISKASKHQLNIIHTCNTVSEGVDTDAIKCVCYMDPRNSITYIIQSLGRTTRLDINDSEAARVLILFFDLIYNIKNKLYEGKGVEDNIDIEDGEIINKTETELINESSYRTIIGILSFLGDENEMLLNEAIMNPEILTKREYEFHLENIIVNKNGGDTYIGKKLKDIKESNVIVCNSKLDGKMKQLKVEKYTETDNWIYVFANENNIVEEYFGSSPEKLTRKPKKFVKINGLNDGNCIEFINYIRSKIKVSRIDKILKLLEFIKNNNKIPNAKNDKIYLFSDLKKNARGKKSVKCRGLCKEELDILSSFFKTKEWYYIDNTIFQKYKEKIFDEYIKEITYSEFEIKKASRLEKIINYINKTKENKKFPYATSKEGNFIAGLKSIKNGDRRKGMEISEVEDKLLSDFFKTNKWSQINLKQCNDNLFLILKDEEKNINYNFEESELKSKLKNKNDGSSNIRKEKFKNDFNIFSAWVNENKKFPLTGENTKVSKIFNDFKAIKKNAMGDRLDYDSDELKVLTTFFKTDKFEYLDNDILQNYKKEFFDDDKKVIEYDIFNKLNRLDKSKYFTEDIETCGIIPEKYFEFFKNIKKIKSKDLKEGTNKLGKEVDEHLSLFFKSAEWYYVTEERYKERGYLRSKNDIVDYFPNRSKVGENKDEKNGGGLKAEENIVPIQFDMESFLKKKCEDICVKIRADKKNELDLALNYVLEMNNYLMEIKNKTEVKEESEIKNKIRKADKDVERIFYKSELIEQNNSRGIKLVIDFLVSDCTEGRDRLSHYINYKSGKTKTNKPKLHDLTDEILLKLDKDWECKTPEQLSKIYNDKKNLKIKDDNFAIVYCLEYLFYKNVDISFIDKSYSSSYKFLSDNKIKGYSMEIKESNNLKNLNKLIEKNSNKNEKGALNHLLKYFTSNDSSSKGVLNEWIKFKVRGIKTSKTRDLYEVVENFLIELNKDWYNKTTEELFKIFNE